jgi:hypothetical protein
MTLSDLGAPRLEVACAGVGLSVGDPDVRPQAVRSFGSAYAATAISA